MADGRSVAFERAEHDFVHARPAALLATVEEPRLALVDDGPEPAEEHVGHAGEAERRRGTGEAALAGKLDDFRLGTELVSKLIDGPTFLCVAEHSELAEGAPKGVARATSSSTSKPGME